MAVDTRKGHKVSLNGYDGITLFETKNETIDQEAYQQLIGSFIYAAVYIRSDIAFAVNKLN